MTNLKINRDKTREEIIREMQELKPYVQTHEDQALKFTSLWCLYTSLNGSDDGVRKVAERGNLQKFIKFEGVG